VHLVGFIKNNFFYDARPHERTRNISEWSFFLSKPEVEGKAIWFGFILEEVAMGQVCLRLIQFSLVTPFPPMNQTYYHSSNKDPT